MLTRLHVKNFRSIEDLDLRFGTKTLFLGRNGTGKTSVFDVLADIRGLVVDGRKLGDEDQQIFPLTSLPRWLKGQKPKVFQQHFEIAFEVHGMDLHYELVLEQNEKIAKSRVLSEHLTSDGRPLFEFREGRVQRYRDDHSMGPQYTSDWACSAMGGVPSGSDNQKMTWFKERMRNLHCLRIDAPGMLARSEREAAPSIAIYRILPLGIAAHLLKTLRPAPILFRRYVK